VSGKDKYRDAVNAFGQATFIPPAPHLMMDTLTKWKNYLYSEEKDPYFTACSAQSAVRAYSPVPLREWKYRAG
jgi:hypothetical protein